MSNKKTPRVEHLRKRVNLEDVISALKAQILSQWDDETYSHEIEDDHTYVRIEVVFGDRVNAKYIKSTWSRSDV